MKTQSYGYLMGGVAVVLMGFLHDHKGAFIAFAMISRASAMGASCATWVGSDFNGVVSHAIIGILAYVCV